MCTRSRTSTYQEGFRLISETLLYSKYLSSVLILCNSSQIRFQPSWLSSRSPFKDKQVPRDFPTNYKGIKRAMYFASASSRLCLFWRSVLLSIFRLFFSTKLWTTRHAPTSRLPGALWSASLTLSRISLEFWRRTFTMKKAQRSRLKLPSRWCTWQTWGIQSLTRPMRGLFT